MQLWQKRPMQFLFCGVYCETFTEVWIKSKYVFLKLFVSFHLKKLSCHGVDIANSMNINMESLRCPKDLQLSCRSLTSLCFENSLFSSTKEEGWTVNSTNPGQKSKLDLAWPAQNETHMKIFWIKELKSKWDTDEDVYPSKDLRAVDFWPKETLVPVERQFWGRLFNQEFLVWILASKWPPNKLGERG